MSEQEQNGRKRSISRGKVGGALIAGALVVGGIFSVQAIAGSKTFQHATTEAGYQMNVHFAGKKRFAEMSDEDIEKRVNRVVRHIAIEIDANDEQQKKIVALVTAVARDMKPIRASMIASRDEMKALLLADTIDREALEAMRVARMAEVDAMSKNVVTALADVAEVLTLEQRRTLEERIREFRGMMGHRRGWRH